MFQESRDGRDGHGRLEEHDLVAPAPHRGGLPRARHAAAADPAHRAAAQARQAGVGAAPRTPTTPTASYQRSDHFRRVSSLDGDASSVSFS